LICLNIVSKQFKNHLYLQIFVKSNEINQTNYSYFRLDHSKTWIWSAIVLNRSIIFNFSLIKLFNWLLSNKIKHVSFTRSLAILLKPTQVNIANSDSQNYLGLAVLQSCSKTKIKTKTTNCFARPKSRLSLKDQNKTHKLLESCSLAIFIVIFF